VEKKIYVEIPRGLDDEVWCINTIPRNVWTN
jgi:hypothetical protein